MKEAGFDVVLSPVVVRNVVVDRTVRRAVDRQVRWNKIRYSFSRALYASELLANPLPFALAAALLDSRFAPIPLLVAAARYTQLAILSRATRAAMSPLHLAAAPLLDLLMLYAWFVPFFSKEVTWRGYRARIGPGTVMVQLAT